MKALLTLGLVLFVVFPLYRGIYVGELEASATGIPSASTPSNSAPSTSTPAIDTSSMGKDKPGLDHPPKHPLVSLAAAIESPPDRFSNTCLYLTFRGIRGRKFDQTPSCPILAPAQ
jgi:hypothetical protein